MENVSRREVLRHEAVLNTVAENINVGPRVSPVKNAHCIDDTSIIIVDGCSRMAACVIASGQLLNLALLDTVTPCIAVSNRMPARGLQDASRPVSTVELWDHVQWIHASNWRVPVIGIAADPLTSITVNGIDYQLVSWRRAQHVT